MKNTFRTILVIGDNPDEIVKKYSADTKVEKYLKMKYADAEDEKEKYLQFLGKILSDKTLSLSGDDYQKIKERYLEVNGMTTIQYYVEATDGCDYDEETGDAYSDVNPNAYYQYERCQQHRLEVTGEEGDFSDPFPLKDETISYSAHFNEIDWKEIHRNPKTIELNGRIWELVVNDDEAKDYTEERYKALMKNRMKYFDNFKTKEDYLNHSTSLWYWGVATEEWYKEVDYTISDMDWITGFYDRFIKGLEKTNPLITIYEVKALD